MPKDRAKLAGSIAALYVIFFLGGMFLHLLLTGDISAFKYGAALPRTWIAAAVGLLIAWGLWHHYRWAWWVGLAAVLIQLVDMSRLLAVFLAHASAPPWSMLVVLSLYIGFLTVLVSPQARQRCTR